MKQASTRRFWASLVVLGALAACSRSTPETASRQPVGRELILHPEALTNALVAPTLARSAARAEARDPSQVPAGVADGDTVRFPSDEAHHDVSVTRDARGGGYALTWTDAAGQSVWFGRADAHGRASGAGVSLRRAAGDEEGVAAPSVLSTAQGYAVAWVDAENGRVRFQRLDAQGHAQGRSTIVHAGLEAPRAVQLATNGREYGVAVALWHGVYFARVSHEGARIGEGSVYGEGDDIQSVQAPTWDGRTFGLSYTVSHQGQIERVQQRVPNAHVIGQGAAPRHAG